MHEVVDPVQLFAPQILEHFVEVPFHFTQEHGVACVGHLFGVEHDGNASGNDRDALAAVQGGDRFGARQLTGEHDRQGHDIRTIRGVERCAVLVHERELDVPRHGSREVDRTVRRKMELGLLCELGPLGVDELQPHGKVPPIDRRCRGLSEAPTGTRLAGLRCAPHARNGRSPLARAASRRTVTRNKAQGGSGLPAPRPQRASLNVLAAASRPPPRTRRSALSVERPRCKQGGRSRDSPPWPRPGSCSCWCSSGAVEFAA